MCFRLIPVVLGQFEDGVELGRVGTDPLGLFELPHLLEEVLPQVGLHQLLVQQTHFLQQTHKLLQLQAIRQRTAQLLVLGADVLAQGLHAHHDVSAQSTRQQHHCVTVLSHEVPSNHHEMPRNASHSPEKIHQLPCQGTVHFSLRQASDVFQQRKQPLLVAEVRLCYSRYQKNLLPLEGLVFTSACLRPRPSALGLALSLSVHLSSGVAAKE